MSILGLSLWDMFFLILTLYFVIRGLFRGFVGEVIALVGFFSAFYFSFHFSDAFGSVIERSAEINGYVAQAVAGVLIWLSISLLSVVVRKTIQNALRAVSLGSVDRRLGICSGIVKTIVAIYVVMTAGILLAPVANPVWMTESGVLRFAGHGWPYFRSTLIVLGLIPKDTTLPKGTLEQILRPYRYRSEEKQNRHNDNFRGRGDRAKPKELPLEREQVDSFEISAFDL